jgi:hypothetical protein
MFVKKPYAVLLIWLAILVVLAVIVRKTIFKEIIPSNKNVWAFKDYVFYGWAWMSLLIGVFLFIVWGHLKERSQVKTLLSKPDEWSYWEEDYNDSMFDKDVYLDAWKINSALTDSRYADTTSIIYLVPLLIAIASVGLVVSLKYEVLRTPLLVVQTSLLTYTLISSDNKIGADNKKITNAKVGYTVTHGALALIPFVLLFI